MKIIIIKPFTQPYTANIKGDLESMQAIVGGYIEAIYPFDDPDVALVCNEEGKIQGLPLSRAIYDDEGQLLDIIAGDFFIAYAPIESEKFLSIPPELEKKYLDKYGLPEKIYCTGRGYDSIKYDPDRKERTQDYER